MRKVLAWFIAAPLLLALAPFVLFVGLVFIILSTIDWAFQMVFFGKAEWGIDK